jgi:hypothetical protein
MIIDNEAFARTGKWILGGVVSVLLTLGSEAAKPLSQESALKKTDGEKSATTVSGKFYCNIKALTPGERVEHQRLTDKLIAARKKIVETDKGYEFQFSPSDVSLENLADWVAAEGKCCRFFDFHIDLEAAGTLLCLRLTGEDGIKEFIRAEFQVAAK